MSILAGYITYLGFGVLTYKTLAQLNTKSVIVDVNDIQQLQQSVEDQKQNQEDQQLHINILKQWLIFVTFLLFEPFLFAIAEILPFGLPVVLLIKLSIIYPRFLIHLYLYELLLRLELDNYAENKIFVYLSTLLKEGILLSLDLIGDSVKYVNLSELPEIETKIKRINEKIGFKQEVFEKKKDLLSQLRDMPSAFKSAVNFKNWSRNSVN